jgi:CheY-like chemotaxis protein
MNRHEASTRASRPRVLCVDDEPHVVSALADSLRQSFDVSTATSGSEGLRVLVDQGPFAVLVSDFCMPGMNGAEFLAQVRYAAPDTVRMLLTGQATVDGAIAAVNEGNVFRFLTKPCPPAVLVRALEDAIEQSRLVTADRLLLEHKLESMSGHLIRADRLASLGTMAGAIGHELKAVCTVWDNGSGIPEHKLPLLFEPYFTTKAADRGTGLGLFVVKHVVCDAGGDVAVKSVSGQSTTFTLRVPMAEKELGEVDETHALSPEESLQ